MATTRKATIPANPFPIRLEYAHVSTRCVESGAHSNPGAPPVPANESSDPGLPNAQSVCAVESVAAIIMPVSSLTVVLCSWLSTTFTAERQ